jgi:aspartyl-tRNA(Asn)/glutamyl-tRNA(Gln) amidotransferase subunit C
MAFSREDVERIAALARLALTAEEKELFARQLGDILRYADEVLAVDTSGVPPTAQPLATPPPLRDDERRPPLRDDVRRPSLKRDEVLAAAPEAAREAGFFKVPRVIG